jgi:hypothetical protein
VKAFFFAPESPRPLALVRIAMGLVLLGDALLHWRYGIELYSAFGPAIPTFVRPVEGPADGPLSADDSRPRPAPRVEPSFPALIPTPTVAIVVHNLLIFSLASVTLGWHTRTSLAAAFFLALWLAPLDVTATFGKHFVVALHLLILLAFSRCGAAWSLDALRGQNGISVCQTSSACPRRLIQILICSVYVGAVVTKIKSSTFANGDLLTFSLLDDRWGGGRFGMWLTTLRHVPLLMSWATLLFEVSFPVLVWIPRWRLPLVAVAFVVHATMGWLLSLGIFTPVIFAGLLAFLEERDLARIGCLVSSLTLWDRIASAGVPPSAGGAPQTPPEGGTPTMALSQSYVSQPKTLRHSAYHLIAGVALVAAGWAVQYSYDWYGAFGRQTLPPLQEVSAGEFAEMLAGRPPAWEDYFHRVELGNRFGGNQVFGSPDRFRTGQRAYILTQMPMPHPTVELEGVLIAPDGRRCARFVHRFDAGFSYAINGFELTPELPPGPYRVILRVEEFVVAERRFELEP